MKLKHPLFLLTFFALHLTVSAQNRHVRNLEELQLTRSGVIAKGRTVLMDLFVGEEKADAAEVRNYLMQRLHDENYLALYPIEDWLALYWLQDYSTILSSAPSFDSTRIAQIGKQIKPEKDMLTQVLLERTGEVLEMRYAQIRESDRTAEEKDFLEMLLMYLMQETEEQLADINKKANAFLATYPTSAYAPFTRLTLRHEYVKSPWRFGYEFYAGYGIQTKGLESNFNNPVILGYAFELEYSRFALYLRFHAGISKTRNDITYKDILWPAKSHAVFYIPEASLGYTLFENSRWAVAPFAGFAGIGVSAGAKDTDKKPELKDLEKYVTAYAAGLTLDYKRNISREAILFNTDIQNETTLLFRLRYTYLTPAFTNRMIVPDGNIHQITLGIVPKFRRWNREK